MYARLWIKPKSYKTFHKGLETEMKYFIGKKFNYQEHRFWYSVVKPVLTNTGK